MMMAALLVLSTTDANAQGLLKKLKQKAQQTVLGNLGGIDVPGNKEREEATATLYDNDPPSYNDDDASSGLSIAQGSDIVPKRRTATITWDGTITPSSASSASALMAELPSLPSAEKMARSTMAERDAYTQKIAAVLTRAEQLQQSSKGCSDAEMEAYRLKWERKVQDLFGLTKEEMAILKDENAPDSKKEPIQQKVMMKVMGSEGLDRAEMERFEKMSEKEQEAYIRQHPEFVQRMQKIAMNAGNFANQMNQMTAALSGYEAKMGKLAQDYANFTMREEQHDYSQIKGRYDADLIKIYDDICDESDAAKVDALYAKADEKLYNYRLEAAEEYRASLQRQIDEAQKFAAEYGRLTQEVISSGDLPECAIGRMDLNAVIIVGNLLDEAYRDLPRLESLPVCQETIYELQKGWEFGAWECGGYVGSVDDFKTPGSAWPLLVVNDETGEHGVVENGKFRKISENELEAINKKADARQKKGSGKKPPYGTYKSRSGKRVVEYSQSGEIIVDGMTTFYPSAFSKYADRLEWITLLDGRILKCTYKL